MAAMDEQKQRAKKILLTGLVIGLIALSFIFGNNIDKPGHTLVLSLSVAAITVGLVAFLVNVWRPDAQRLQRQEAHRRSRSCCSA
ncbi:MAG: hypothetical protein WBF58_18640 [Xanthobacteraceae bacterium]